MLKAMYNKTEGKVQEMIDDGFDERENAKKLIESLIDKHHLPCDPEYGVIFEGMHVPRYKPWNRPEFARHRYNTLLSLDRLYMVAQYAIESVGLKGKAYECGVYEGGVTRMLLDMGYEVEAFDTFEGIKGANEAIDIYSNGEYASSKDVFDYIKGARINQGEIPYSFNGHTTDKISFAHIDLDVFEPTKHALNFIYPRLVKGGVIIVDDYGFVTTPGVKKAVDLFQAGHKIYIPTGQMIIYK
jgi:hypothetical protein